MRTPPPNRVLLYAFATCALLTSLLPPNVAAAQAQQNCRKLNAFEVCGHFLEEWSKQGSEQASLYVNGLPITTRRPEISMEDGKLYDTQWFERARYEAHPDNKKPFDVLLGRLGYSTAEGRGKIDPATGRAANPIDQPFVGIDKPADADGKGKLWLQETKHTISGRLLDYWNRYGGLQQFGYPLSEPFQEISQADGKLYSVQYFERNRMELHPEKPPPYDVELGLLGVEQYRLQAVAGDQLPVAPARDVKTTKDTITVAMREPPNLSFTTDRVESYRIRALIEDGLVGRDENENIFPLDAPYVPTLENGGARFIGQGEDRYLQVKYKLRQGIKWSDGKELTSNDAMFAYRLIMHPRLPIVSRVDYLTLQSVDNPDKHTILYNFRSLKQATDYYNSLPDKANYDFVRTFIDQKKPMISKAYSEIGIILPEHVLGKIAPDKISESNVATAPIGTGPWKVERWIKGREMVLVPNEHYSLTARPAIKTITIKFVLEYGSIWTNVKIGIFDMLTSEGFTSIPEDVQGIKAAGLNVIARASGTWEHLDFLMSYEPFQERAVREAIITAINRKRLVDEVYGGAGAVLNGVVPPGVYYSLENPDFARTYPDVAAKFKLPLYQYNPERAARLLEDAGWTCPPGSSGRDCGGRTRAKGDIPLSFVYMTAAIALRQQIQARVSTDLKAIGVDAIIKNYPVGVTHIPNPNRDPNNKLTQFAWISDRGSDFGLWVCRQYEQQAHLPDELLRSCLFDPDLRTANDTFNTEIDPVAQALAAAQAQVIIMREIAVIPLLQRPNIELVSDKLANYKLPYSQLSSFWNARQWYFK